VNETQQIYDRLWQEAAASFAAGNARLDPRLPDKVDDPRRGVTLLLRPDTEVANVINGFLGELRGTAPGQYFYRPEEFHVTVLAIIPGSERWQDKLGHVDACRRLIGKVLNEHREFAITFQGLTATAEAVMIQGFPEGDTLLRIRDRLRKELRNSPLGQELDRRYRIHAAHLTVMRFCRPAADWRQLKERLEASRARRFGVTRVRRLQLVLTDWYGSADRVKVLEDYRLGE